jgi:hypothetical protein
MADLGMPGFVHGAEQQMRDWRTRTRHGCQPRRQVLDWRRRAPLLLLELEAWAADIVCLQEVRPSEYL